MGTIDDIYIIRYVILPLAGFLVGSVFFFLIYKKCSDNCLERFESYVKIHHRKIFYSVLSIFSIYYLVIIILRYYSLHLGAFDFGIYDHRIWQIHIIPWAQWTEKLRSSLKGHFHPILMAYSILYDFDIEPVILNILQAIFVLSGIIPLYRIAKIAFKSPALTSGVCILYLLYPATQFNIAVDFHPDHLIIPILFWCYYFIKKENYVLLIPLFAIGYTIKEPLILSIAFMGLYMAWEKKKYAAGIAVFLISVTIFYIAVFVVVPQVSNYQTYQSVQRSNSFAYLFSPEGFSPVIKEILRFEKWRFPFFLLFPFLFLPLFRVKELLPAIPLLLIPMLSTNIHHQNVASQYTAGIIPPVFVSFISAIVYLHKKFGGRIVLGIFGWISILMLAFNVAHSPTPLSIAFWDKDWSHGKWHYTNYVKDRHEEILWEAVKLLPSDPKVKIVTHSGIYDKKITHRNNFGIFPEGLSLADYILLDNSRGSYILDNLNEDLYRKDLKKLRADINFKQIFNKDGILLFKRLKK